MTPLETEANPNIRVGPLRWGRPVPTMVCAAARPQVAMSSMKEARQRSMRVSVVADGYCYWIIRANPDRG